ncbi:U3 small nucleolar RNA-associated protein 20 [Linum perenne]
MATLSDALAVKSLNKSSASGNRYKFKNNREKSAEIKINVFRSLDVVKSDPVHGAFFVDWLVERKELDITKDFISLYEEMFQLQLVPSAESLSSSHKSLIKRGLNLHKDAIISALLSRLHMQAHHSLESILRLIAELSRDLLEDFIIYLPRVAESLVSLLESGGDQIPDIIEQIFTAWSYILKYLKGYLDIVNILKISAKLIYYPKDYIQKFAAEATSYLLRNAYDKQLQQGIREAISEAVEDPSDARKDGVSALLYNSLKSTSSSLHSKAKPILQLLIGDILKKHDQDPTVFEVVDSMVTRLCKEQKVEGFNLLWDCLHDNIDCSVRDNCLGHLSRTLTLLVSTVEINKGRNVPDYLPILECVGLLVEKVIKPYGVGKENNELLGTVDKIMQLMLCILDGLKCLNDEYISSCSLQWAATFNLKNRSCLTFIDGLLKKDMCIVKAFQVNIISAMNNLKELYPIEVVHLLLCLCELLQNESPISRLADETHCRALSGISAFLRELLSSWLATVNNIICGKTCTVDEAKLAFLWRAICCFHHVGGIQGDASLMLQFTDSLNVLLMSKAENIAGVPRLIWESLIGPTLRCYVKHSDISRREKAGFILRTARAFNSSLQALTACADCLDVVHRAGIEAETANETLHPEFGAKQVSNALAPFVDNLCNRDKDIRLLSLRILCHYELESYINLSDDQPPSKKMKIGVNKSYPVDNRTVHVLQLLRSIEETPLSLDTSRKVVLLISNIQTDLLAGRICETYLPIVLSGMIGILYNNFNPLRDPASECLGVLIEKYVKLLWDKFIDYFQHIQTLFLKSLAATTKKEKKSLAASTKKKKKSLAASTKKEKKSLAEDRGVTPTSAELSTADGTCDSRVLKSLLQSLKRIPSIVESHSRYIVPLLLKFLGYDNEESTSVGSFNPDTCRGKEWKGILKEWLALLKLMKNSKALYKNQLVKDILRIRLMDDSDADVQMDVLDCLLTWKDEFLVSYQDHLRNLISPKGLKDELIHWSISRESCCIEEGHRSNLVPLIIVILMAKVTNLRTLASRKHKEERLCRRKKVLRFIAQLEINEISLFYVLLVKSLDILPRQDGDSNLFWTSPENYMDDFEPSNILKFFMHESIMDLSWDKQSSFVHVIEDILEVFDELRIRPFLNLLMGCVVRLLLSCSLCLGATKGAVEEFQCEGGAAVDETLIGTSAKEFKQLRSLCLKLISGVLNKYDDHDFGSEFWDMFFSSVEPLIRSFKHQGSSSEKPSSLFSCFTAMGKSQNLVSLLCRESSLVPSIFSILTVKTASKSIVDHVLKFIENLLILDEESADNNNAKLVLLPNLDELTGSLHSLFKGDGSTVRKRATYAGKVVIRIFKLLSKFVNDLPTARTFLAILLQLLAARVEDTDTCIKCLQTVRDTLETVPQLANESCRDILKCVSPLLISSKMDVRVSICDLLGVLAKNDPSVLYLAELLSKLNATMEVDDLDYETIVSGYETIGINFFYSVKEYHAIVILSQCVYHMSSEELIVRHSAYRSLLAFVEFSAQFLGEVEDKGEMEDKMVTSDGEDCWTSICIRRLIKKFILSHIGKAVKAGSAVRKEWIELLRDMVLKLPVVSNLGSFKTLCSEDAEQDFFKNIIHLQKHKRAKALKRFKIEISRSNMSEASIAGIVINKVFVPLFFNMMSDVQAGKGEDFKVKCADALASISAHVGWGSYNSLLMRCFQEMDKNLDKQKILLRLVCSVLENFHFSHASSNQGVEVCGRQESEIQECFENTLLPKIQKLLSSDSDKVNVVISVIELKLLKLLPGDRLDAQLPGIIHRIADHLKSHKVSIRNEARGALVACLKELGLDYLQLVVRVLQSTLKQGSQLHVLGYTLNFILSDLQSTFGSVKLDYCLEELLDVVENDILGDVAAEKEVEKIASKMKETRKRMSFETLKTIAENITFKTIALKLHSRVTALMHEYSTPKAKTKLQSMLTHIAAGIERNPSVDPTDLFTFIHSLIERGVNEECGVKDTLIGGAKKHLSRDARGKRVSASQLVRTRPVYSHLITVFALELLDNRMKSMKMDKSNIDLLAKLDPFVKLLGSCLTTKYEDILSASLRCLTRLVRLPLPSLASQADNIKATSLDIAESSVNANSPLMESCLRLLMALLQSTKVTLSSGQLHMLIQFPLFMDLERNPSSIALSLLKVIVRRKLVVPEIYDVILRVAELMVTSQVESVQKKCSQILFQFLREYDLTKKHVHQHLEFLEKNLRYVYPSGRKAVLEMLHVIIVKFHQSFPKLHVRSLFVQLVDCLANDVDREVRSLTGAVIKLLVQHMEPNITGFFIDSSLSWYKDENLGVRVPGAQVLGLLVEVAPKAFRKHVDTILPIIEKILLSSSKVITSLQTPDPSDDSIPFWKEAYYSLILLEKILNHFAELGFERKLEGIWKLVMELLLHPHTWLRNATSRLVAFYFSKLATCRDGGRSRTNEYFLLKPSRLFKVAASLCCQLKTKEIGDAAGSIIMGNLVFAIREIRASVSKMGDPCKSLKDEEDEFLKCFNILNYMKAKNTFVHRICRGAEAENEHEGTGDVRYLLVSSLLRKLGEIALQTEDTQMKIVFGCYKSLSEMNGEDLKHYAYDMLVLTYKVCEGYAGRVVSDDVKQIAAEVNQTIENAIESQNFVRMNNEIRKRMKARRDKRKVEEKVEAVVNPTRNAKRKLRVAAKHRGHKRRKITFMKMGRWMH